MARGWVRTPYDLAAAAAGGLLVNDEGAVDVDRGRVRGWSGEPFVDLAPGIVRQRLVVEGIPAAPIGSSQIVDFLRGLSAVCGMVVLLEPVTHRSDRFGWAGWTHWETSGAHFYAWDAPHLFFSVDIYTCKAFDPVAVKEFTSEFFAASRIVAKEF